MTFTLCGYRYTLRLVLNRQEFLGRTTHAIGLVLHLDEEKRPARVHGSEK